MPIKVRALVVAATSVVALGGCVGNLPQSDDDCNGSILFGDVVYVVDNRLNQKAQPAEELGPGEVVDCDHSTVVDDVVVSRIKGVEPGIAIRVLKGDWRGVYIAEGVPKSSWPDLLSAS